MNEPTGFQAFATATESLLEWVTPYEASTYPSLKPLDEEMLHYVILRNWAHFRETGRLLDTAMDNAVQWLVWDEMKLRWVSSCDHLIMSQSNQDDYLSVNFYGRGLVDFLMRVESSGQSAAGCMRRVGRIIEWDEGGMNEGFSMYVADHYDAVYEFYESDYDDLPGDPRFKNKILRESLRQACDAMEQGTHVCDLLKGIDIAKHLLKRRLKPNHPPMFVENSVMNTGWIYLVEAGGRYKIGKSKNPKSRIKDQSFCPFPLTEVGLFLVPEFDRVEKGLHKKYSSARKKGEWFEFDDGQVRQIVSHLRSISLPA